ncbi:radical SAM protein [Clostridium cellulovorans]|uniref:Elongator protein 3/MiaB/NifB n=1 Tax=Clostridium cellulovorans (strain ATCC 35296 / DSM 3052 / OCM 3 / 743B) TaxID=573061 RepID=D9SVW5_CLOC7|nr:radical SAM protein [Clostridium cellulovorans]ADL53176.1 Elongator protein 3/MiaB/NifB [Clostridium cellulovorans 743B]
MSTDERKTVLYEELRLKNQLLVEGINVDPDIFKNLDLGGTIKEQVNALFAVDHHGHTGIDFPACIILPKGFRVGFHWDKGSQYSLKYNDGRFQLFDGDKLIIDKVIFEKRPNYYSLKTSDGTSMATVAQDYGYNHVFVAYSNECALKDKGKDCLFCNINATKDLYAESQNIKWKTAKQIGETVAAAYKEGNNKVTISGGFIPERREVDYYIDVAEAIKEYTGLQDFNGTATIGAPLDFSVFDKYKEAGYRTVAINLEVWDENIFKTICPGKSEECGGRENWLNAIEYALKVFGKFKVRSTFVSGLEPKSSILEAVEYLVSRGVIASPSQWNVNVGSALEGHRTPRPEWHFEVATKTVAIYRKYGVTWDELNDANASADTLIHDIFRVEEGLV